MTSDSVSDRLDLSDLLDTYARGVDSKDWDLVASAFTPDAQLDYTAFGGPKGSREDVVAWIAASVGTFAMSQHHITNRSFAIEGDEASSVAQLFAVLGMTSQDGKMTTLHSGGVYKDTYRRTSDGWKIARRVCDNAWLGPGPEVSGPTGPA